MEDTTTTTQETVETVQESTTTPEQVSTPEQTTTAEVVQEVKPFELPKQDNPISFDKPEDVLSAYKGDKKALLQHLGFDDFILGINDYYKATGDVTPYLEVKTVDWTKLPAERVAEAMLREQYSKTGLPEDKIQKLINADLRDKYKLGDDYDPESEDVQLSRIRMEAEVNGYRQQRIEQQQKFKAPERVEEAPTINAEQLMEQTRNELLQDQSIQTFLKDKKISFGDYNHGIENPNETLATIYDTNRWTYHLAQKNEQGQVIMKEGQPVLDKVKMLKVAAYVENMEKIEQALINQGKSLGQKEVIDEAENVNNRQSQGAIATTDDLETQIAKKIMERQRI